MLLGLIFTALLAAEGAKSRVTEFVVVAHPEVSQDSIDKDALGRLFLKKTTKWPDGTRARPVDQPRAAAVRELFCRRVFGKSAQAVASFWRQSIFSGGGIPPPTAKNDSAVIDFVAKTAGAVGYVSNAVKSFPGVKLIVIKDR
ncbi:MAG: phosphate ABC transporter substrate-binding protein [Myxococcota bacterium]